MPRIEITPEVEGQFVELLAHLYGRVNWGRMNTSKNAWDIWNHRVRAAATRGTLGEFVSRLCNQLGLQSAPPRAIALMEVLRPYQDVLLTLAYREHIYISMRAALLARQFRQERREREEEELS